MQPDELEYVGFWRRIWATTIDAIFVLIIVEPIIWVSYGESYFENSEYSEIFLGPLDIFLSLIFPSVATILFWRLKQATPGKMLISTRIVDEITGGPLTIAQSIRRYFAYLLAACPFGLGFVWVAFDARKRGWHDMLAGTVVVRNKK